MKTEEAIALEYLKTLFKSVPEYEPDGKVPPDFYAHGDIAIEVRRLNQHKFYGNEAIPLENDSNMIYLVFDEVLRSFDVDYPIEQEWIYLDYERPIGKAKGLKRELRKILKDRVDGKNSNNKVKIGDNISLTFVKSSLVGNRRFRIGSEADDDVGGWGISFYAKNINYCIAEKELKIADYYDKYNKWWLILVDTMVGFDKDSVDKLLEDIVHQGKFTEIHIVDYLTSRLRLRIN